MTFKREIISISKDKVSILYIFPTLFYNQKDVFFGTFNTKTDKNNSTSEFPIFFYNGKDFYFEFLRYIFSQFF